MPPVSVPALVQRKKDGERIAVLTAYDYPSAQLVDEAQADVILVGDSCAMVVMGRANTLSMTMDEMVYHTQLVANAAARSLGGNVGSLRRVRVGLARVAHRRRLLRFGHRHGVHHGRRVVHGGCAATQADGLLPFADLHLVQVRFFEQLDEFFDFAQVHYCFSLS